MTPDEIEAERERFEASVKQDWPSCSLSRDGSDADATYDDDEVQNGWFMWLARAEIAHAREAELRAEIERLRERIRRLETPVPQRKRWWWGFTDIG